MKLIRFTKEEDLKIKQMASIGRTTVEIASSLNRTVSSIRARRAKIKAPRHVPVCSGGLEFIKTTVCKKSKTGLSHQSFALFLCRSCGMEVERMLSNGVKAKSCGCLHYDHLFKHGHSPRGKRSYGYGRWASMVGRCHNPDHLDYGRYGARGIFVCDEWRTNAGAFIEWCGENGIVSGVEVDRINNDGPYSPENCRPASRGENVRNSTRVRLSREDVFLVLELSLKGVTRAELARKFNVSSSTISCIARGKTWRGFESDFKKTNMMEASNV